MKYELAIGMQLVSNNRSLPKYRVANKCALYAVTLGNSQGAIWPFGQIFKTGPRTENILLGQFSIHDSFADSSVFQSIDLTH
jgi:hypothetical protein